MKRTLLVAIIYSYDDMTSRVTDFCHLAVGYVKRWLVSRMTIKLTLMEKGNSRTGKFHNAMNNSTFSD